MRANNNRNVLLVLLALLAVIRFLVVPVLDWQKQLLQEIDSQTIKLAKSERVLAQVRQIEETQLQVQQINQALQKRYTEDVSLQQFKLQLQQQFESLCKTHNVEIKGFNWIGEIAGEITESRAKVTFSGKTKDLILLQLAIAEQQKLWDIREFNLNFKGISNESLGNARGDMVLVGYNLSVQMESTL